MTLLWQTLTLAACFAFVLANPLQPTPTETPERVCRHVICWGILRQHLRAILYVLGDFATTLACNSVCTRGFCNNNTHEDFATRTHRNTDFATGFRCRNAKEILYLPRGCYIRSPPQYRFCYGISLQEPEGNPVLTRGTL